MVRTGAEPLHGIIRIRSPRTLHLKKRAKIEQLFLGAARMANKLDAVLKIGTVAALLIAASGIGYYYGLYLPARDARLDAERRLAASEKDLHQAEALQRYQQCQQNAAKDYSDNWAAACQANAAITRKEFSNCLALGGSKTMCSASWGAGNSSPDCLLPGTRAKELNANLEQARNLCLKEYNAGIVN